jgi:hypothetical protein
MGKRREEAIEAANEILDENAAALTRSMLDIALDVQAHPVARANVGMKLLDKIIPTKTGPLVSVTQRNTIVSHLNLPTTSATKEAIEVQAAGLRMQSYIPTNPVEAAAMVPKRLPAYKMAGTMPKTAAGVEARSEADSPPAVSLNADPEPKAQRRGVSTVPKVAW